MVEKSEECYGEHIIGDGCVFNENCPQLDICLNLVEEQVREVVTKDGDW